ASRTGALRTVTAGYVMDRDLLDLDLDRFNDLLARAQHAPAAQAYPLLLEALAIAAEPLLANEPTAAWAEAERQTHTARLSWAMVAAANAAAATGQNEDAIQLARRAIDADKLDENAWSALLAALRNTGRHADALHAYEQCRQLFIDELGCTPGPALQGIHHELLQGAAEADGSLADLLSALLCLHAHTNTDSHTTKPAGTPAATPAAAAPAAAPTTSHEPLRDASRVLTNLLKQAQLVMQTQIPG
ncbi:bacterial transcriptional activator domain-containing protein, partial [Arthrobacter monumenti]